MIGKLLKWFGLYKEPKPKRLVITQEKFLDPLYPPDLAECFPENRTETYTDNCYWQKIGTDDKE